MVLAKFIIPVLIILLIWYIIYQLLPKKQAIHIKIVEGMTEEDLDVYVEKLGEKMKEAERRYNNGIESAKTDIENYQNQLNKLNDLKTKNLKDL